MITKSQTIKINQAELAHAEEKGHWTSTWDGITGAGKFTTSNHKGDTLLLVAVSTQSSQATVTPTPLSSAEKEQLAQASTTQKLHQLITAYQDPVLAFHATAKGGFTQGAKIKSILPQARPADLEALGYCVLMSYPPFTALNKNQPKINLKASFGTQLVEAAMIWAYQQKLQQVFAYSRPSSLRKHLQALI